MTDALAPADAAKAAAARAAVALVEDGMRLGLGTGSTAAWFVRLLAERVRAEGLAVRGVPTSEATARLAREQGLHVTTLEDLPELDLTVDGADETDDALRLIKGGGGALLREKIVAAASARMVVIADASKRVATLGHFPLPVEIVRFGAAATLARIATALEVQDVDGRDIALRGGTDAPFLTDEGHLIADLHLGRIGDPEALERALLPLPGVVETGLFLGMAERAILATEDGTLTTIGPL